MEKCGWCEYSYRDGGLLKCPYFRCRLSQEEINELLKLIFKTGK